MRERNSSRNSPAGNSRVWGTWDRSSQPHHRIYGAGDGNRTRIRGLGSRYSTTEPRPPCEARVKTNRSILWPQALLFPDCSRTNSWIRVRAVLAARAIRVRALLGAAQ